MSTSKASFPLGARIAAVAIVAFFAPPARAGETGSIKGTVKLVGKAPKMESLKRDADPFCKKTPMTDEEVVVGPKGGLKNVLVRIAKGLAGTFPTPPGDVVIKQEKCMYRPRVHGVVAGQNIVVKNGDQTLHNVHTYKGSTTVFNQAQPPGVPPISKKLTDADKWVKFKCDVHPWMTGHVFVSSHPFFAVSGDDGSFILENVPPGKYTVEAWHEKYGTKTIEVDVPAGKAAETAIEFTGN